MSKKIAPTVEHAVLCAGEWDPSDGPYQQGIRELRALLAVARAAQRMWEIMPNDMVCEGQVNLLARALDRLDRVSK